MLVLSVINKNVRNKLPGFPLFQKFEKLGIYREFPDLDPIQMFLIEKACIWTAEL